MIQEQIRNKIEECLKKLQLSKDLSEEMDIASFSYAVEPPKVAAHGDFATNLALLLARQQKKSPRAIAELLAGELRTASHLFDEVSVAGPGFINFKVSSSTILATIPQVLLQGDDFGKSEPNGKRVVVEFVSANPTGPLHLGHARGAIVGDAVARLLAASGFSVTREFYINDAGNQIRTLGKSIYTRYRELFGEKVELAKGEYPGQYVIDIAKMLKQEDGDRWLLANESEWLPRCVEIGIRENLADIKETLSLADIRFDSWFSEQTLHHEKKVEKVIDDYRSLGMLYDAQKADGSEDKIRREASKAAQYGHMQKGGTFLRTSKFGDTEDRILLKANGDLVYLAADLAYHQDKFLLARF